MTVVHRFANGRIIVGGSIWPDARIEVAAEHIVDIRRLSPTDHDAVDLDGGWIMPGFVDTQVNGGGGVLFNDEPTVAGIAAIGAAHAAFGTTAFLPTLISDTPERIAQALGAMDDAIAAGVPGVVGVHIEGPFLNPVRKGIHDPERFRVLDQAMVELLTRPRRGRVMVTLAPELAPTDLIATLAGAGVIVSAGHSEATYDEMIAALDAGVTGVTHLYNAMSPMTHRAPGLVGAALDDPRAWCGLIVDGVHAAPAALRIAIAARGIDRMMLVTDAMSSVGAAAKDFMLQGRHITVADGICSYEDGTLAGSDLDMAQAVANTITMLRVEPVDAARMAAGNPAAFLGLSGARGRLTTGLRADWAQLSSDLRPVRTIIGGRSAGH